MLVLDWFGCALSAAGLMLLFRGRWSLPRAVLALVLGEAGRFLAALLLGLTVSSVALAGLFTRIQATGPGAGTVASWGPWLGAPLALLFGRRRLADACVCAAIATALALMLPG